MNFLKAFKCRKISGSDSYNMHVKYRIQNFSLSNTLFFCFVLIFELNILHDYHLFVENFHKQRI